MMSFDLLSIMQSIAPSGALVAFRDLRVACSMLDYATFNAVIKYATQQGLVCLHRHDYPLGCTSTELHDMVTFDHVTYFVGCSIRKN